MKNLSKIVLIFMVALSGGLLGGKVFIPQITQWFSVPLIERVNLSEYGISKDKPIKIYTVEWCDFCRGLKAFLKQRGVSYVEVDIEKNKEALAEFDLLQGQGYPLVLIEDTLYLGFLKKEIGLHLDAMINK